MAPITRRRRLIRRTAWLATGFVAVVSVALYFVRRSDRLYLPGQPVQGLTAELERELPADYPRVTLTDASAEAGIQFSHFGGIRSSQLPEDMGSGAAWGDYDNDGWADLFVVNSVGPIGLTSEERARAESRSVLYHNNRDGTFTDVTDLMGIDHRTWGMAAAWGDYDSDGWIDLVVTAFGAIVLYRNEGGQGFRDTSAEAGMARYRGFWSGAVWGDYDRDGRLDLYVVGYVAFTPRPPDQLSLHGAVEEPASLNPSSFPPERNLLFHNEGNGTFSEVAERLGVADARGRGMGAAWVDVNEDGWPDLYVANDVSDNALFLNRGQGRFLDVSHAALVADYRGAMGLAIGDWDGDLDQDIVVTHWIAQENALYDNLRSQLRRENPAEEPPVRFTDEADRFGLGQIALDYIGWGTSFIDYDNDGRLDLFIVNGSTFQDREDPTHLIPMRDQLFWNRGPTEGFFEVSPVAGPYFARELVGRGAAFADYDNDGDLDALIVNHGGPAVLLRNDGGNAKPWLQVDLRGTQGGAGGLGARLRLVAGGVNQVRQVGVQSSYLSQNSPVEHFGLGSAARVDTLEVVWPGGSLERLVDLAPGQRVLIREGQPDGVTQGATPSRERVREFWTRYREATSLRMGGDARAAAEAYERAIALDPRHEDGLYYLGSMRLALGEYSGAESAWRRLIDVNPSSARAHSQLGRLFLCLDPGAPLDPRAGVHELLRAQEINREQTGPLLLLGEAALLMGDTEGASRRFREVLASNPQSVPALAYTGYLVWKAGRTAEAQGILDRARAPRSPPVGSGSGLREGDTRTGASPLLATTVCREPWRRAGELGEMESDAGVAAMRRYFSALDSVLRAGVPNSPR